MIVTQIRVYNHWANKLEHPIVSFLGTFVFENIDFFIKVEPQFSKPKIFIPYQIDEMLQDF